MKTSHWSLSWRAIDSTDDYDVLMVTVITIIIIIEQGPFSKAKSSSPSQKFPGFWKPTGSVQYSQQLVTAPYPKPDQSSPSTPISISWRYSSISCTHLRLGLQLVPLPQVSPPKPYTHFSIPYACYIIRLNTWIPPLIITAVTNNYYYFSDIYVLYTCITRCA